MHGGVMAAIGNTMEDQRELVQAFRETVIRVIGSYSANRTNLICTLKLKQACGKIYLQ